jgi:hypothetical protein
MRRTLVQSSILTAAIVMGSLGVVMGSAFGGPHHSPPLEEFAALLLIAVWLFSSPIKFLVRFVMGLFRVGNHRNGPWPPPEGSAIGIPVGPHTRTPQMRKTHNRT